MQKLFARFSEALVEVIGSLLLCFFHPSSSRAGEERE